MFLTLVQKTAYGLGNIAKSQSEKFKYWDEYFTGW
jgi:hypothetical protein